MQNASAKHRQDIFSILRYVALMAAVLLIIYYAPPNPLALRPAQQEVVLLHGTADLRRFLQENAASLRQVRKTKKALPFRAVNLPADLADQPHQVRTAQFIVLILSQVLICQEKILQERHQLLLYIDDLKRGGILSEERRTWYSHLAARYRMPDATPLELLPRVDIVPASLAIAQAITESGWGTSRFAQQGNALYGQHLPNNSNGRSITARYDNIRVAAFDSLLQSTASYMHTINTARAYSSFRALRHSLRQQGRLLDGHTLAAGLHRYAELGNDYIVRLRSLIDLYHLDVLDQAALDTRRPPLTVRFLRAADTAVTDTFE